MTALSGRRHASAATAALATVILGATTLCAEAQTSGRDAIGDLLSRGRPADPQLAQTQPAPRATGSTNRAATGQQPAATPEAATAEKDPREGDAAYEQAQRLMKAIDAILQDTAKQPRRGQEAAVARTSSWSRRCGPRRARTARRRSATCSTPRSASSPTCRSSTCRSASRSVRKNIRDLDDRIVKLREKQLAAPKDGMLPGIVTDTVDSLGKDIEDAKKRIELNRDEIAKRQGRDRTTALDKSGVKLAPEQVDLLLDSVLSGDLVRLVAVFNSAKLIDGQLGKLMAASGDNIGAARKYFAMHAALFAMLVHAQDTLIAKIDTQYLPKLDAIAQGHRAARKQDGRAAARREPARPEARARSQPRQPEARRGGRQGLPPLPAAAARADRRAPASAPPTTCASPTTPSRRSRRASSCAT